VPPAPSAARRVLFWLSLIAFTLLATLGSGELFLRVVYRDRGHTTLGGPGGGPFDYTYNPAGSNPEERQPFVTGSKHPGVTRIMIQGDSITWGVGVRRWQDLYPSRLLSFLRRDNGRYDMAV